MIPRLIVLFFLPFLSRQKQKRFRKTIYPQPLLSQNPLRASLFLQVGHHAHGNNAVRIINHAVRTGTAFDFVNRFHTGNNLSPYRVLMIKERRIRKADEKLTVGGIRIHGARHRNRAAFVRQIVKFGFQIKSAAAGAVAARVARLRHKAFNHPVKL